MSIEIRRCTVAEIQSAPNIDALLQEYSDESANSALGHQNPQFDIYQAMESAGIMFVLGAFQDATLIGFMAVIVGMVPHYGKRSGTSESYFVAKEARKTGAGQRLRQMAEQVSAELGAAGFFISAPVGGQLEHVLPRVGYDETNRIFFKALPCSPS